VKIKRNAEVAEVPVQMEGASGVTMRILIGPEDGSNKIIMRYFKVLPGGHTPRHSHNYEHLVKIERGRGLVIDEQGEQHEVRTGQSIFVEPNREHQFRNPFPEPFEFICIIPNPETKWS